MTHSGFFLILAACAVYGVVHSALASNTVKRFTERKVGREVYQRFYRLFFVLAAFVTTLPLLALVPLLPDRTLYRIPAPWVYLTLAVQALAAAAILIGVLETGASDFLGIRQLLESGPGHTPRLVVTGLYRWVRHPLYSASLLILWLTPVMSWNVLALNIGFSAYLLIGTIFEERKLAQQFGEAYLEYRERTPRILPGVKLT